jgi:predicted enzyme related to lactoylglutathione lyase
MSQFQNVNVVYYYVKDWERAKKFYRETLEWPVAYSDDQVGWEEYGVEGQTHVAINRWEEGEPPVGAGGGTCTFSVEDVFKTTEALRAKGVKCKDPLVIPGVVAYGTFFDPEGNRLQFAGMTPPPS